MNAGRATTIVRERLRRIEGIAVCAPRHWERAVAQINAASTREAKRRGGRVKIVSARRPELFPDALLTVRSSRGAGMQLATIVRQPGCAARVDERVTAELRVIAAEHGGQVLTPADIDFIQLDCVELVWPEGE